MYRIRWNSGLVQTTIVLLKYSRQEQNKVALVTRIVVYLRKYLYMIEDLLPTLVATKMSFYHS